MTVNASLDLTPSGRILTIQGENGRVIAEILVHGPLGRVIENCKNDRPVERGYANIFRGELFGLAGYEFLNVEKERIEER